MHWIAEQTRHRSAGNCAWLAGTCAIGFLIPFLGVDRLALPRPGFVLLHLLVGGSWLLAYFWWVRFTLAYILSANPLAPVLAHVALHVAALVHALATSAPLPPHY